MLRSPAAPLALLLFASLAASAAPASAQSGGRGGRGSPPERAAAPSPGGAGDAGKDADGRDKDKASDKSSDMPHLPPPASVKQMARIGGREVAYTASVGALPVKDDKGKVIAEVVVTSYLLDGPRDPARPVTFAFNGGPGRRRSI